MAAEYKNRPAEITEVVQIRTNAVFAGDCIFLVIAIKAFYLGSIGRFKSNFFGTCGINNANGLNGKFIFQKFIIILLSGVKLTGSNNPESTDLFLLFHSENQKNIRFIIRDRLDPDRE